MKRNAGLDLLRAVALMMVLFHHLDVCGDVPEFFGKTIVESLMRGGWAGVDCFFVLSGFLVSGLIFREHQKTGAFDAKRFLIRRGLKIYPAFYAMIGLTIAVYVMGKRPFQSNQVIGELIFFQNYIGALWRHTWSLAVEEHFYFILVLLLVGLFSLKAKAINPLPWITYIYIGTALATLCARIHLVGDGPPPTFDAMIHQFPTHLRIDSLFLGVLLSAWAHYRPDLFNQLCEKNYSSVFALLAVMLFLPAFVLELEKHYWLWTWGYLIFSFAGALSVLAVLRIQQIQHWLLKAIVYIGGFSYSIYLWHMIAGGWFATRIMNRCGGNWYIGAIAYFVLCLLVGIVMGYLIEWPVLRLRDRYFRSRN